MHYTAYRRQRSVQDLQMIHESLRTVMPEILNRTAARSVYEARSFKQLVVEASALANNQLR